MMVTMVLTEKNHTYRRVIFKLRSI